MRNAFGPAGVVNTTFHPRAAFRIVMNDVAALGSSITLSCDIDLPFRQFGHQEITQAGGQVRACTEPSGQDIAQC